MTLSSAIFALTAAFSGNLLGKPNGSNYVWILLISWVCLSVSIWSASTCQAVLINYLQDGTKASKGSAILRANISHNAMLAGLVLFAAFAILSLRDKPVEAIDAPTAAGKAVATAAELYKQPSSDFTVQTVEWVERAKMYDVTLNQSSTHRQLRFEIDSTNGHVIQSSARDIVEPVVHHEPFEVQYQLAKLGYKPGPVDGVIGKRTIWAITRFQVDHGLAASGMLDLATLAALFHP